MLSQSFYRLARGARLDDDEVDEEVGGRGEGGADAAGDVAGALDEGAQLAEYGTPQHGPQEHVEDVPDKKDDPDAPVQAAQGGRRALLLRDPAM